MRDLSRREFIRVSALVTAGTLAAACTQAPPAPEGGVPVSGATPAAAQPGEVSASRYQESPVLAEQVKAGELPPVEERLPEDPPVIQPLERTGKYGGTWRSGCVGLGQRGAWTRLTEYEQLVRWTPEWDGVLPCIAQSFEANEEGTEFTFHLHKGIKWSDGEPFTASDIEFWYEDILLNEEYTPEVGSWLVRGDEPVALEKVDDYTVTFRFKEPHGFFLKELCIDVRDQTCIFPRHYYEQFHPKYNPSADEEAKAKGYGSWAEMVEFMSISFQNADLPVLYAWKMLNAVGETTTRVVSVRNPYYWKVDPEGRQLPYIDEHTMDIFTDNEPLLLKTMNGEMDWIGLYVNDFKNKSVFVDNMEQGDYRFVTLTPTEVNEMVIQFNMNCTDPVKREIFQNKDFRIGMSHAINREEVNNIVFMGQGQPWQAAPRPESRFHHERLAKQYTEYDVDLANEYLDKAGYAERDADGFRLGPDGKRIAFVMEIDVGRTTYVDSLEVIKPMWDAVGVEMILKTMERSLWEERCRGRSLDFHASAHRFGGGGGDAVMLDPRYWFPQSNGSSMYAKAWAFWYNNPEDELGEEPPEDVKRAMEMYREIMSIPDDAKQSELLFQILDIAADQFYHLGTILEPNLYAVVTNRLKNVPDTVPQSWNYPTPAPYNTCQFFIEE